MSGRDVWSRCPVQITSLSIHFDLRKCQNDPMSSGFFSEQIQQALRHTMGPQVGIPQFIQRFEAEFISIHDLELLGNLAIRSGYFSEFIHLCAKKLDDNAEIPWAHFVQCLKLGMNNVSPVLKKSVYDGAQTQKLLEHLCRTHFLDDAYPDLPQIRRERISLWNDKHHFHKKELLSQVEMLRTQGLDTEEELALRKLQKFFPKDLAIQKLMEEAQERKALLLLEAKVRAPESVWEKTERPIVSEEEREMLQNIISSMSKQLKKSPDLARDFAVALLTWDHPEGALEILQNHKKNKKRTKSEVWLQMESLLMARRFVALLTLIDQTEASPNLEPDDTFGLLYLRARAFWGLGNRFSAIEILENLVNHRPTYRSALTLLRLWKDGGSA